MKTYNCKLNDKMIIRHHKSAKLFYLFKKLFMIHKYMNFKLIDRKVLHYTNF